MLNNYLTIALRNLRKYKGYASINVIGLAVGIACCLVILLYVQDEWSYDRYHTKADRIYRVIEFIGEDGADERSASAPIPVGEALRNQFPQFVEQAVRFFDYQAPTLTLAYEDRQFNEPRFFFADSAVFQVFNFSLRQGNPATALTASNTLVLSASMAEKYFPGEDPIDKVLRFQDQHDFRVTGVMDDVPANSHFIPDFLASFTSLENDEMLPAGARQTWYWNPAWTYVLLAENVAPDDLAAQFPAFVREHFPDVIKNETQLLLQPLTDIHLRSALEYEIEPNSSEANVYIFSAIALFILLIACINFMNLATARSAKRAKEVGMRKVLGAQRSQLIRQFLMESMLLSVLAVGLALALAQLALPIFDNLSGKALRLDLFDNGLLALGVLGVMLAVGLVSGLYPAFFLSAFKPLRTLKGANPAGTRGLSFRRVLVVAQFSLSIFLISGTLVAYNQLDYLLNAELGFEKEQVILMPVSRSPLASVYETFREEALRDPNVLQMTALEEVLGAKHQTGNYQWDGMAESRLFPRLNVRHSFTETFGIELAAGRDYDQAFESDETLALVVNEAMVREMGWGSPQEAVGITFATGNDQRGQIVGVVKDFNYTSLHQPIQPLVLDLNTNAGAFNLFIKYVAIRVQAGQAEEALAALETLWDRFVPSRPFDYFFLDARLDQLYRAEQNMGRIAGVFAGLAILVACLGLLGMVSFAAEQRTKEIGIRKVLGAPASRIVVLLLKDFLLLVAVAFVIALPVAYFILERWVGSFAYGVETSWWIFIIAGLATLLVALLTISYQTLKAAFSDPVKSLRYE